MGRGEREWKEVKREWKVGRGEREWKETELEWKEVKCEWKGGRTRVRRWAWKKRPCRPSGKRANASGKTEEVEREWGGGSGKSDPVGHGIHVIHIYNYAIM